MVLDAATDALSITIAVLDRIRDKAEVLNSLGYGIIAGSKLKAWKQANDDFWAALLKIIAVSSPSNKLSVALLIVLIVEPETGS